MQKSGRLSVRCCINWRATYGHTIGYTAGGFRDVASRDFRVYSINARSKILRAKIRGCKSEPAVFSVVFMGHRKTVPKNECPAIDGITAPAPVGVASVPVTRSFRSRDDPHVSRSKHFKTGRVEEAKGRSKNGNDQWKSMKNTLTTPSSGTY